MCQARGYSLPPSPAAVLPPSRKSKNKTVPCCSGCGLNYLSAKGLDRSSCLLPLLHKTSLLLHHSSTASAPTIIGASVAVLFKPTVLSLLQLWLFPFSHSAEALCLSVITLIFSFVACFFFFAPSPCENMNRPAVPHACWQPCQCIVSLCTLKLSPSVYYSLSRALFSPSL